MTGKISENALTYYPLPIPENASNKNDKKKKKKWFNVLPLIIAQVQSLRKIRKGMWQRGWQSSEGDSDIEILKITFHFERR